MPRRSPTDPPTSRWPGRSASAWARSSSSSAPLVLPFASRVDAASPPAPGLPPSAGPVSDADAWPRAGADDGEGEGEDEGEEGVVFSSRQMPGQ